MQQKIKPSKGKAEPAPPGVAATVPQVAAELQCSERHVWDLISEAKLRTIMVGRIRRVPPAERERLLREGA